MMDVLVVDDSIFMRKIVTDILATQADFRLTATARNGKQALELVAQAKFDLILLDVVMPVLGGLETLGELKKRTAAPVIMLTGETNQKTVVEALALGAVDFIEKPTSLMTVKEEWINNFCARIRAVSTHHEQPHIQRKTPAAVVTASQLPNLQKKTKAVVIGASTGGPGALLSLIAMLPDELKMPLFIVQHMPKEFTASFAARLNQETQVTVVEARDGEKIEAQVYLCPGNQHMTLAAGCIKLDQRPKLHGTRPAVDYLFNSAAAAYGPALTAIILTGMGKDGTAGMKTIKQAGGYTIAQDEASSVVFGMPRSAIENEVVDEVLSLEMIGRKLRRIVG
ncbi:chemotaxis-specific protein-glutamate methyltransferase CheB [Liquorilactobacillus satsumensis]|uniref:Protein-glutamate methylesterase/protein-glutamine glutaminase n=2 Tax=Liquorilactobacillus satsumensis TaxID=259059 RepID=A0A0R1V7Z9_9LACO|nr:chemotaxis-specific protein-glutamate methyltransferase CheB [Liquorilactobacillus satsumensis]AJA34294.1 two-component system chemotaxis family response regulator CheB [Liquorilactobacillus satsumensis]KRL99141.1 chemotaxis response regulator protein-glutamate methylesterase [Liquorilactobacillus satsumensis DSM 16230 = JCM 12392]